MPEPSFPPLVIFFNPLLLSKLNIESVLSLAVGYAADVTAIPFLCFVV